MLGLLMLVNEVILITLNSYPTHDCPSLELLHFYKCKTFALFF